MNKGLAHSQPVMRGVGPPIEKEVENGAMEIF